MITKINLVGIALTSYNPQKEYLLRQLNSILNQSYLNWVCCICIDGDENKLYEDQEVKNILQDERFHLYFNTERLGFLKNFQKAIQKALTFAPDSIVMADHDDEWTFNRLELQREKLIGLPEYSLVHCDMLIRIHDQQKTYLAAGTVWKNEKRVLSATSPIQILLRNLVGGASSMIHAKLFTEFPAIPEGVEYHDHWYALLVSQRGKIEPIFEPLYYYSQHGSNVAGVGSFEGHFTIKENQQSKGILSTCLNKWKRLHLLALTLTQHSSYSHSMLFKLLFLCRFDLGIINFIHSFKYFKSDPALFRSAFSLALGKFLSLFMKG